MENKLTFKVGVFYTQLKLKKFQPSPLKLAFARYCMQNLADIDYCRRIFSSFLGLNSPISMKYNIFKGR